MNVAQLVQLGDTRKHLRDVEPRMLLLEHARVVEEGTEVTAGDEVLREVKENRGSVGIGRGKGEGTDAPWRGRRARGLGKRRGGGRAREKK